MAIANDFRSGQTTSIDNGCMIQLIGQNRIMLVHDGRDGSHITVETGLVSNCSLRVLEFGEFLFKSHMQVERSVDGSNSS
ncbi:hypothetical protein D3C76_1198560 [compost metagenome]